MTDGDDLNKRKMVHDLEDALYTFTRAVREIEQGYRFDDSMGQAKIKSISKALTVLENGVRNYIKTLQSP